MPDMDSIPFEVVCVISQNLDTPDLCALSLTSKRYERAAATQLFHTIRLTFALSGHLDAQIRERTNLLSRRDSLHYVQRLEIRDQRHDTDPNDWKCHCFLDGMSTNRFKGDDEVDVASLLHFVRSADGLQDIVWACCRQFPLSLLEELHESRSNCKLHLEIYHLRRPARMDGQRIALDDCEWALVTSPCLYSFAVCCSQNSASRTHYSFVSLEISMVVLYYAPCLKKICVLQPYPQASQANLAQWWLLPQQQEPQCKDAVPDISKAPQGALTSLEIRGFSPLTGAHVEHWFGATRFDLLKELTFNAWLEADVLQYLSSLNLCSLQRLSLWFPPRRHGDLLRELRPFYDAFLQSLVGLHDLEIHGGLTWDIVNCTVQHHGATLRRLSILSLMVKQAEELQHLKHACSRLTELSIAMPRTHGDSHEFEIYSTLGEFRNLQQLNLLIDCSITSAGRLQPGEGLDASTWPPGLAKLAQNVSLQELDRSTITAIARAWQNSDVDEDIVATIFQSITESKPARAIPLQTLELRLRHEGEIHGLDVDDTRRLIDLIRTRPGPNREHPSTDDQEIEGVSWKCRRQVHERGIVDCAVSKLDEDKVTKKSNIEDDTPRGLDIRPLILRKS